MIEENKQQEFAAWMNHPSMQFWLKGNGHEKKPERRNCRLIAKACGEPGLFQELVVAIEEDGKDVADIVIGLNIDGALRIITTTGGQVITHDLCILLDEPASTAVTRINQNT